MPNAQGFDYFYGTPRFNGFTVLVDDTSMRSPIFRNQEVVVESVEDWDHITADYTHEAIDWIDKVRAARHCRNRGTLEGSQRPMIGSGSSDRHVGIVDKKLATKKLPRNAQMT